MAVVFRYPKLPASNLQIIPFSRRLVLVLRSQNLVLNVDDEALTGRNLNVDPGTLPGDFPANPVRLVSIGRVHSKLFEEEPEAEIALGMSSVLDCAVQQPSKQPGMTRLTALNAQEFEQVEPLRRTGLQIDPLLPFNEEPVQQALNRQDLGTLALLHLAPFTLLNDSQIPIQQVPKQ